MAQGEINKEDKFDFTDEGEVLGYVSLEEARILAMRTARDEPGNYGYLSDVGMVYEVLVQEEREDYYEITMSFRPEGNFAGTVGREQFFIDKQGSVAYRQVLAAPKPKRALLAVPLAVGLVLVAIGGIAAYAVLIEPETGGSVAPAASTPSAPTSAPKIIEKEAVREAPPVEALKEIEVVATPTTTGLQTPTRTRRPTSTLTPTTAPTLIPSHIPTSSPASTPIPLPASTPRPTATHSPTQAPESLGSTPDRRVKILVTLGKYQTREDDIRFFGFELIRRNDNEWVVGEVIPGSSADMAGIQRGATLDTRQAIAHRGSGENNLAGASWVTLLALLITGEADQISWEAKSEQRTVYFDLKLPDLD
jgi:hypothetical protein